MLPTYLWISQVSLLACALCGCHPGLLHTHSATVGIAQVNHDNPPPPPPPRHHYHHHNTTLECIHPGIFYVFSEILGALLSVFTIWLVTGVLVYLAVERLINQNFVIEGTVMLITSGCAVAANIMYIDSRSSAPNRCKQNLFLYVE